MKLNHKIQILKCAKLGSFSKWINAGLVFLLLININSCNFPEDLGTERMINTPYIYHFETGSTGGTVSFNIGEELRYQVVLAPKWMDIKTIGGLTVNGEMNIPFQFNAVQDYMDQGGSLSGELIVRMGNIGLFSFIVSYGKEQEINPDPNPDYPMLICNLANLNFESEVSLTFTLTNPGAYDNSWFVGDVPSWLQLSESRGTISGGNQATVQCTINREGMASGIYSHQLNIISSNSHETCGIFVTMRVDDSGSNLNQANVKRIEGIVKDVYLCKATDYLYILTQKPNQLLYKLPDSDSLYVVSLNKGPNCIDVSKDGSTLAIGYNQAVVDLFDAQTFEIKRTYNTDCVPFDLVFGENGWCYLTPDLDQWVYLYSLNLTTGITYRNSMEYPIYEKTIMVKDPNKPLLYATRPQLSPEGVMVINIAKGAANDSIPYWHEETAGKIWVSGDGEKLFAGNKKIFTTPDFPNELHNLDLPVIGRLDVPRNYIRSFDFCESLKSYFVVGSDYPWTAYNAETIYQLDAESFDATNSVKVQPYPGSLANQYNPKMDIHYVFTNKSGTKLYAIKNVS